MALRFVTEQLTALTAAMDWSVGCSQKKRAKRARVTEAVTTSSEERRGSGLLRSSAYGIGRRFKRRWPMSHGPNWQHHQLEGGYGRGCNRLHVAEAGENARSHGRMSVAIMIQGIRQLKAAVRSVDPVMRLVRMLHQLGVRMPVGQGQGWCHKRYAEAGAWCDE